MTSPTWKVKNWSPQRGPLLNAISVSIKQELGIGEIISAKDHAESFLMLQNGRAAAFMMDDILLAGEKSKAKDPNKWDIVGTAPIHEIYGCMLRKGDTGFKQVVDDAIKATYSSGEINKMYKKWFQHPIPPKNINLNFPMSDQLKRFNQQSTWSWPINVTNNNFIHQAEEDFFAWRY